jgi:hypothetical protein
MESEIRCSLDYAHNVVPLGKVREPVV